MGEAAEHDASGSNFTSGTSGDSFTSGTSCDSFTGSHTVELDAVRIETKGEEEEAGSPSGPTPIMRVRRPSYSRLAAPPAVRPSPRPRTRRPTHDLAYGRARIEAAVVCATSSSVPSQRTPPFLVEE